MPVILKRCLLAISPLLFLTLLGGCEPKKEVEKDPVEETQDGPISDHYQPLGSTSTQSNVFGGVGIRSNNTNDNLDIVSASGSIKHSTGALNYDDGSYNLIALNGFSSGDASDGTGGTLSEATGLYTGNYDYVMPVTFSYTASDIAYTTQGFAGLTTEADHIPGSGLATYIGEATGSVVTTSSGFYNLASGASEIVVDFGASTANVTLNGFTATDALGAATTAPLDTVSVTDMTINGSTFTGGTLTTLLRDTTVNLTGANTTANSEGAFFGWDNADDTPDELAGVSVVVGDDGILLFSYIAD